MHIFTFAACDIGRFVWGSVSINIAIGLGVFEYNGVDL